MPKVSIITTCYNHSDYIGATIESILGQSFSDWELLIGDDLSPDNSYDVVSSYVQKDTRIKAWQHPENLGIVGNINFLLEQVSSESEYICFLEGDDLFTPDHLEKKLEIFAIYPEVKMVYNNLDFIGPDGAVLYPDFLRDTPFYLKNEVLEKEKFMQHEKWYGSYSSLMFEKKLLQEVGIRNPNPSNKMWSVSDWDLFFRIVTQYKSYGMQESLTLYRRHPGNVSGQYLKLFGDLEIQMQYYLQNGVIAQESYDYKMGFIQLLKSVAHLEKGNKKQSFAALKKSLSFHTGNYIIYKIAILGLICMPQIIINFVLGKVIKR